LLSVLPSVFSYWHSAKPSVTVFSPSTSLFFAEGWLSLSSARQKALGKELFAV
jgi:hypothetical protein